MNLTRISLSIAAAMLLSGALAHAAKVSGTVTDKTTGKPAAGDTVVLVDVQAGMAEAAHAATDAKGHYTLNEPGSGPYLIRVTHQGSPYFIAAPESGPGDIPVYDAAPKVEGISLEADVLEMETANGQLNVNQRFMVHNTSSPPRTQYSPRGFEIVLPPDAVVDSSEASRPTGLPTNANLTPTGQKGHFTFDFPIQPDEGDKQTQFQIQYHLPYSGKYTFHVEEAMTAENLAVLLPKSITFAGGSGASFQSVQNDPNIQTLLTKNVQPGKTVEFTVSGEGSMPRENQGGQQQGAMGAGDSSGGDAAGGKPGGGIGAPIDTPDPLSKYKLWILGALALVLAAGVAFLLRKPAGAGIIPPVAEGSANPPAFGSAAAKNATLLNVLKEELFTLESEKLSGKISAADYTEVKSALETVLKRALQRNS